MERGSVLANLSASMAQYLYSARFPAKRRLIAIEVEGLTVLAEIRQVFRKMPGALGHEIAKVPKHFATNLFINVIFGFSKLALRIGYSPCRDAVTAGTRPYG